MTAAVPKLRRTFCHVRKYSVVTTAPTTKEENMAKIVKAIRAKDNDSSITTFEYEVWSQQKTERVWPP